MIIEKKVSKDTTEFIERLQYEVNARKDLCAFMINSGMSETESFKKYHNEYMEETAKYQIAKEEFQKDIVKKDYPNAIKWNLRFADYTVEIEVPDEQ